MFSEKINSIINDNNQVILKKEDFGNIDKILSNKEIFINNINDFNLVLTSDELNETNYIIIYVVSNSSVSLEDIINLSFKIKDKFDKKINIKFGRKIDEKPNYILVDVYLSSQITSEI